MLCMIKTNLAKSFVVCIYPHHFFRDLECISVFVSLSLYFYDHWNKTIMKPVKRETGNQFLVLSISIILDKLIIKIGYL